MNANIKSNANVNQVVSWLKGLGNTRVFPVKITIKGTVYDAVQFKDDMNNTRYYVLGNVPAHYKRSKRCAYTAKGREHAELYINGHADDGTTDANPSFHPFGPWFGISTWYNRRNGGKIDANEPRPYERIGIEIAR